LYWGTGFEKKLGSDISSSRRRESSPWCESPYSLSRKGGKKVVKSFLPFYLASLFDLPPQPFVTLSFSPAADERIGDVRTKEIILEIQASFVVGEPERSGSRYNTARTDNRSTTSRERYW
jgi:hypothetical protein